MLECGDDGDGGGDGFALDVFCRFFCVEVGLMAHQVMTHHLDKRTMGGRQTRPRATYM